ncbi:MAG: hypothetical protein M1825_002563 [Sarcosagium campestre]|nr:MAG: hypothetical protein M1825_002563 [Sarcosagium campestre]
MKSSGGLIAIAAAAAAATVAFLPATVSASASPPSSDTAPALVKRLGTQLDFGVEHSLVPRADNNTTPHIMYPEKWWINETAYWSTKNTREHYRAGDPNWKGFKMQMLLPKLNVTAVEQTQPCAAIAENFAADYICSCSMNGNGDISCLLRSGLIASTDADCPPLPLSLQIGWEGKVDLSVPTDRQPAGTLRPFLFTFEQSSIDISASVGWEMRGANGYQV